MNQHVEALIKSVGLMPEDVHKIVVTPGQIEFSLWAKNDDGSIATIDSEVGSLPLSFTLVATTHDHEHGPDTHTHDDAA